MVQKVSLNCPCRFEEHRILDLRSNDLAYSPYDRDQIFMLCRHVNSELPARRVNTADGAIDSDRSWKSKQ